MEGKRTKEATSGTITVSRSIGGPFVKSQVASEFLKPRLALFE